MGQGSNLVLRPRSGLGVHTGNAEFRGFNPVRLFVTKVSARPRVRVGACSRLRVVVKLSVVALAVDPGIEQVHLAQERPHRVHLHPCFKPIIHFRFQLFLDSRHMLGIPRFLCILQHLFSSISLRSALFQLVSLHLFLRNFRCVEEFLFLSGNLIGDRGLHVGVVVFLDGIRDVRNQDLVQSQGCGEGSAYLGLGIGFDRVRTWLQLSLRLM